MSLPHRVKIVEVGPRDGLQNEPGELSVATRVELIEALADAGLSSIEAGSFVSPKWVPKMAGSDQVFAALRARNGVTYSALTPNMQGLQAALAASVKEVAVFGAASEAFSAKNINCTIAESLERFKPVARAALDAGVAVRGYISCVVGCPYQGDIAPSAVVEVAQQLLDMGCYEISLGDTVGVGTPNRIGAMLEALQAHISTDKLAVHFHDTYGQALANIYRALEMGISTVDSSVAGLGGCPYAAGASGNVATEEVVYLLNGLGIEHGVDLAALAKAGAAISAKLNRPNGSKVGRAVG
ncbi:MAG: hydroxymethylglutaryl-CoA lyase [Porticoccaceae bacterium]